MRKMDGIASEYISTKNKYDLMLETRTLYSHLSLDHEMVPIPIEGTSRLPSFVVSETF